MIATMDTIYTLKNETGYELLDSGEGNKLERFGDVRISRPDPQALWKKELPESEWKNVVASFDQVSGKGKWRYNEPFPEPWEIVIEGITFILKPSVFKHVGVFPEQAVHWKWLKEKIEKEVEKGQKIKVLNLFGYTGGSSLACSQAGAEVCHVDSSEFVVDLAMKNRDASGLKDKPIRFIVEDVRKFVEREIRRGNTYDVIIMDPPVYGKGVKKEVWNLETDFPPFLFNVKKLLSKNPLAILINGYASGYSHITYSQMLTDITKDLNGKVSSGDLAIESKSGRLLPSGIFARFEK